MGPGTSLGPIFRVCSTTPRFSLDGLKTAICACPGGPAVVLVGGATRGVRQGGYTGWVYRVGTGEGNTGTPSQLLSGGMFQRSGPRKALQGPGVGGNMLQRPWTSGPTSRAGWPGRSHAGPSLVLLEQNPASWPIRARFRSILLKVSQNGQVSPKITEKACHSPCFQNAVGKSTLEILRFRVFPAFSHKELMGHF